jgi:hypothetical protein
VFEASAVLRYHFYGGNPISVGWSLAKLRFRVMFWRSLLHVRNQ